MRNYLLLCSQHDANRVPRRRNGRKDSIKKQHSLVLVLRDQAQPRPVVGLALAAAAVLDLEAREVGRRLDDLDVAHGG